MSGSTESGKQRPRQMEGEETGGAVGLEVSGSGLPPPAQAKTPRRCVQTKLNFFMHPKGRGRDRGGGGKEGDGGSSSSGDEGRRKLKRKMEAQPRTPTKVSTFAKEDIGFQSRSKMLPTFNDAVEGGDGGVARNMASVAAAQQRRAQERSHLVEHHRREHPQCGDDQAGLRLLVLSALTEGSALVVDGVAKASTEGLPLEVALVEGDDASEGDAMEDNAEAVPEEGGGATAPMPTRWRGHERARPAAHRRRERPRRTEDQGQMRCRTSWALVVAAYRGLPDFQRMRLGEMGFGEFLSIEPFTVDLPLIQAIRERWDRVSRAFLMPWGHMIPSLEDVARITGLRVHGLPVTGFTYADYTELAGRLIRLPLLVVKEQPRVVARRELMKVFGLEKLWQRAGETSEQFIERAAAVARSRYEAKEEGEQADLELRRFLFLLLGRLLFATKGDSVHCRFLSLLEDLSQVGRYAWGAAVLASIFADLTYYGTGRETSVTGFAPLLQLWSYYYIPLGRAVRSRPALFPRARQWLPRLDVANLDTQLRLARRAICDFPSFSVAWEPWLGEPKEFWVEAGQCLFGREIWLHCLNDVELLRLSLVKRTIGLHQEWREVQEPPRVGRRTRGKTCNSDWSSRAKDQYADWVAGGTQVTQVPGLSSSSSYLETYRHTYRHREYMRPDGDVREEMIAELQARLSTAEKENDVLELQLDAARIQLRSTESQLAAVRADLAILRARYEEASKTGAGGASSSHGPPFDGIDLQRQLEGAQTRAEAAVDQLLQKSTELLDLEGRLAAACDEARRTQESASRALEEVSAAREEARRWQEEATTSREEAERLRSELDQSQSELTQAREEAKSRSLQMVAAPSSVVAAAPEAVFLQMLLDREHKERDRERQERDLERRERDRERQERDRELTEVRCQLAASEALRQALEVRYQRARDRATAAGIQHSASVVASSGQRGGTVGAAPAPAAPRSSGSGFHPPALRPPADQEEGRADSTELGEETSRRHV